MRPLCRPVAAGAKICPHCGVKKPTQLAAQANLDTAAGVAAKAGCLIIMLIVILFIIIGLAAGCAEDKPQRWQERGFDSEEQCWRNHGWDDSQDMLDRWELYNFWCGTIDD